MFSLGVMTAPRITNSLLRLDGISASLPPPFERPHADLNFSVLELGANMDMSAWRTRVVEALTTHEAILREAQRSGASTVLFVESTSVTPVRFDAEFLRILADVGIALEHSHENA